MATKNEKTATQEIVENTEESIQTETVANEPKDDIVYIYIGPRIKNGLFAKGKLVDASFKEKLKDEIEKCPNLAKLFIDVNKYAELLPKIEDSNSKYKNFIKEVLNYGI